jgi:hypothetical protein
VVSGFLQSLKQRLVLKTCAAVAGIPTSLSLAANCAVDVVELLVA